MKQIRVLIAKPGLDGHDRGALIIAQALRDHGMEVIYTGLRQTPEQIAQAAVQEDVDVVGLSSLSGAHRSLFPKVIEALKSKNAEDIPVIGGGVIPSEDIAFLEEKGVKKIFTSGASTDLLAHYIKGLVHSEKVLESPKKISHIGIAVESIDQSLPFYEHMLGLALDMVEEVDTEKVKVAFLSIGESRIELLEPLSEESAIRKFLNKKGEGIHHIALEVDSLEERLLQLKNEGVPLLNEEPKQGANNSQIAFIHPKGANGVLFELTKHVKGSEE
ncbi:methylmalonyl-CoA epimerase [Aquibacillus sp. 3ASR75-11]|uniref:Methylmalonyl-CoA epimerase n=1 Tax=Terrihalobacillus insolitus TaxID=2950438 RepID=A0A9X3WXY5_9BACI|nr:methylmalonyl-CoA epimerase [Terrihalobacillus insolitus]MDC3414464.1 methylmalonyl-CoA epimerase [Terrihalobacillus insolitus]MDC3425344.1 methylmalonyl-CoA epimerase [Terrihalobacillus insolitus]